MYSVSNLYCHWIWCWFWNEQPINDCTALDWKGASVGLVPWLFLLVYRRFQNHKKNIVFYYFGKIDHVVMALTWIFIMTGPFKKRDHFVYAPSQWETTLQCNVVSHWLGTYWNCKIHVCCGKTHSRPLNTLRLRQNGCHLADDIFKCNCFNENVWISIKMSLKFLPEDPVDNILYPLAIIWTNDGLGCWCI